MRKISSILGIIIVLIMTAGLSFAQNKKRLTVLDADAQNIKLNPHQLGNLFRLEIEKMNEFEVMDRYDVNFMVEKHNIQIEKCYGKICLVEIGKILQTDYMLSGTVELFGETIIITVRLINVKDETIEKIHTREFLNLQNEMQAMIRITLYEMFGKATETAMIEKLTKKYNYESALNNPQKSQVNLSGPRMGVTLFTGEIGDIMQNRKDDGGYDVYPVMSHFGYQFEIQYLNQSDFQALVEIIPMITGIDQQIFIPSISIMNGLRYNKWGLEFAVGPIFSIFRVSDGYWDNGKWYLEDDWQNNSTSNPNQIVERLDSRGHLKLGTGFVIGIGKTFKTGRLNIPINFFTIPNKDGFRFGLSFGYNAKKQ